MQQVFDSLLQVFSTAEVCAERGVQLPALILAYSAIDSMGWMAAEDPKARVRDRFVFWVDKYALPAVPRLSCTSVELYAARCGVLHTLTADSDLTERGVRRIVYAWGAADLADLERATLLADPTKWVAVHISDLTAAVRLGTAQMLEDAQSDSILATRLAQRGAGFFESIGKDAYASLGIRATSV
jgi:hypothetical protein